MNAYEQYLDRCKKYAEETKDLIKRVNKTDTDAIFPQNILLAKTVSDHLENDKAKTLTIGEEFYFTEKLVNKLMYFAYLKGVKAINDRSFKRGWDACREDVASKLEMED